MPNRTGNFSTAILAGLLASGALAVAADGSANAAGNCLPGPKGAAPKGSHWYYRIDHATKRNCWYVRAEGGSPASANPSLSEAPPQAETPLQPSIANARAEAGPADIAQSNETAAIQAVDASADDRQSMVGSRWLDQSSPDFKNLPTQSPADSGTDASSPAPPAGEIPLAAADLSSASSLRPVQTLLLAIIGAAALAGLMAGAIFRFGSARRYDRQDDRGVRRAPWDSIDMKPESPSPPRAASAPTPRIDTARERREATIPNEITELLARLSREATT